MTAERLDALEIPLQVPPGRNTTPFDTAFCVGIEARRGVTTGISAADRATTILTAIKAKRQALRPRAARSRVSAAGARRRRAGARRPDRGGDRPGAHRRALSGRRDLRDRQGRRHHGPRARPDEVRAQARPADHHRGRSHPLPDADRAPGDAGRGRGRCRPSTARSASTPTRACSNKETHVALVLRRDRRRQDVLVRVHSSA